MGTAMVELNTQFTSTLDQKTVYSIKMIASGTTFNGFLVHSRNTGCWTLVNATNNDNKIHITNRRIEDGDTNDFDIKEVIDRLADLKFPVTHLYYLSNPGLAIYDTASHFTAYKGADIISLTPVTSNRPKVKLTL